MSLEFTLPFSALNQIPAVSGVDDVSIDVPDVGEIAEEVQDVIAGPDDIARTVIEQLNQEPVAFGSALRAGLREALFSSEQGNEFPTALMRDIGDVIAGQVDISGVTSEDIVEAVLDALDVDEDGNLIMSIEGSLFATDEAFVDIFRQAIEEADFDGDGGDGLFGELVDRITDLFGRIGDLEEQIDDIEFPDPDELADELELDVADELLEEPGGELLEEPDSFVDDQVERVTDGLVSTEARQELEETLEATG